MGSWLLCGILCIVVRRYGSLYFRFFIIVFHVRNISLSLWFYGVDNVVVETDHFMLCISRPQSLDFLFSVLISLNLCDNGVGAFVCATYILRTSLGLFWHRIEQYTEFVKIWFLVLRVSPQRKSICLAFRWNYQQDWFCFLVLYEGDVKHYRIRRLDEGGFFFTKRVTFSTLNELVSHYSRASDGLCVTLGNPCLKVRWLQAVSIYLWG